MSRRLGHVVLAALTLATGAPRIAAAQDSVTVVPGAAYAASHGLLGMGGAGWRAAWGAPVALPVLAPGALGGGLADVRAEPGAPPDVAVARGRADGLARRVRPLDRDLVSGWLPAAPGGAVPSFLRDLTSAVHPTAPLLAAALYERAGLPVVRPVLGVLPPGDVPGLVPGTPVWVERAADVDGQPFLGFPHVVPTAALLARLRDTAGTRVDERAWLAARLLDVVLGDPLRGPDAWVWGRDTARGAWVPVARAQDGALFRADRGSRLLLGAYRKGLVRFDASPPRTRALTATGWDLDRAWLARLPRSAWDSVAAALAARLDDAAIEHAVAALPAAHRDAAGAEIAAALRARRDALDGVVAEYYRLMVDHAELEFGSEPDRIVVSRLADGAVEVSRDTAGLRVPLRRFERGETREVRLHLGEGADVLVLEGVERGGVALRVTGGAGADTVVRTAPGTRRVVLYDEPDGIVRRPDDAARLVPHAAARQQRWAGERLPSPPDFGVRRSPRLVLAYVGGLGVIAGAGMQWTRYGFDQPQYRQRASVSLAYATGVSSFRGTAAFERRDVLHDVHLAADLLGSGIEVVNFHGLGNETADTADGAFYRAVHEEYRARLMVGFGRDPALAVEVGPVFSLLSTDTTGVPTLVASENPYGAGEFDMAGLEARVRYQPDRSAFAEGIGVTLMGSASVYPALLDVEETFGGVSAEADVTWVPRLAGRLVVAARLGGSVLRGRVPFARAARVGGPRTLRGYAVDRFAGDRGSAYGSLELRSRLVRFRLAGTPGDLGVLAFGSGGRVWASDESSSTLHTAAGGGLWIAPAINWLPGLDELVGRVELAVSEEGTFVYFGTGFRF